MEKSYAGKVKNSGAQTVEAVYPQKTIAKPQVKTGGDLRTPRGGKK